MMYTLPFDLLPSPSKPRNLLKVFVITSQPQKIKSTWMEFRSLSYRALTYRDLAVARNTLHRAL